VPFDELCPDRPDCSRAEEISRWLGTHPEVTRYAVIDDECDGLDDLPLVQPSPKTGLTDDTANVIVSSLEGKTEQTIRSSAVVRMYQNAAALLKRSTS
jgi:hypothetical protein